LGPIWLVAGALTLAAACFVVIIVPLGPGIGSASADAGIGATAEPRALLTPDERETMAEGSVADGFDHNEDGGRESEEQSLHGMVKKAHGHYRKHMHQHAARYALSFVIQTAITFGVAWVFRQYGPVCLPQESIPDRDPEVGRAVFAYGLLDEKECWSEDLLICILCCCCPGIQWANNVTNPKIGLVGSFWIALMLASLNSWQLHGLTHGVCFLVWVAVAVTIRQRLRRKYGLESGSLASLGQDIFVWYCCHHCAVAQEARQVEHVRTLNVGNMPYGDATQLQVVDEEPSGSHRTLLRPTEDGIGRENTANTDVSGL